MDRKVSRYTVLDVEKPSSNPMVDYLLRTFLGSDKPTTPLPKLRTPKSLTCGKPLPKRNRGYSKRSSRRSEQATFTDLDGQRVLDELSYQYLTEEILPDIGLLVQWMTGRQSTLWGKGVREAYTSNVLHETRPSAEQWLSKIYSARSELERLDTMELPSWVHQCPEDWDRNYWKSLHYMYLYSGGPTRMQQVVKDTSS